MKNFLLIGTLFFITHASAGTSTHGGNSVIHGKDVSLLDLVESSDVYFNPQDEKLPQLGELLEVLCRKLNLIVRRPKDLTWIKVSHSLNAVNDSGAISTSVEGDIQQLALQRDGIVLIDATLYEKMNVLSRRALVIHELLIATALRFGYSLDSDLGTGPLRNVVALISQDQPERISQQVFLDAWKRLPVTDESSGVYFDEFNSYVMITRPHLDHEGNEYLFLVTDDLIGKDWKAKLVTEKACALYGLANTVVLSWSTRKLEQETSAVVDVMENPMVFKSASAGELIIEELFCSVPNYN